MADYKHSTLHRGRMSTHRKSYAEGGGVDVDHLSDEWGDFNGTTGDLPSAPSVTRPSVGPGAGPGRWETMPKSEYETIAPTNPPKRWVPDNPPDDMNKRMLDAWKRRR